MTAEAKDGDRAVYVECRNPECPHNRPGTHHSHIERVERADGSVWATTAEVTLAAFPELRDTDYGRYLDSLTRDAERYLLEEARFTVPTDMEGDN